MILRLSTWAWSDWKFAHLVGRFFGALRAAVADDEVRKLAEHLSRSELQLFRSMTLADQRHSLDLFYRLRRDGHDHPDLLRAALLHDVGKVSGSLPLAYRVVFSLVAMVSVPGARWLADGRRPRAFRPFYVAAYHAALGAQAASSAGSNPTVTRLIAGHGAPGIDRLSFLLYRYDGSM